MDWEKLERPYYFRSKKYEGGKYLLLSRKHKGALEYVTAALNRINKDMIDFCDAGCGNGIYLGYLKNEHRNINLCGFDFSEKIVEIARSNTGIKK